MLPLADAIYNFKWVKIILISQNSGQRFLNIADQWHVLAGFESWHLIYQ